MTNVLAIIVNYKSAALTARSLHTLIGEKAQCPGLQVRVVENDSGDAEALRQTVSDPAFSGWVELIVAPKNGGFSYGNNMALRPALASATPPDYVFFLNPDTEVHPGAVGALLDFLERNPKAGFAGAQLQNEDGTDWNVAFRFPNVLGELEYGLSVGIVTRLLKNYVVAQQMNGITQVDWLPGAAMMIRREVFDDVGLMDEGYFLYYEETDFCLAAARAGWECWYVPTARVMHICGQSTGVTAASDKPKRLPGYWFESRRRYFLKNYGLKYALAADLAYLVGLGLSDVRRTIEKKKDSKVPHLLGDVLRHSVFLPKNQRVSPTQN